MSTIVGSLAAELGLDTAKFEEGLKRIPGMTQQHMDRMSAEVKRASKEGAESLRIFDEAFGIHISRPVSRIITQDFPGLGKALQSVIGYAVGLGVITAAFDFISRAVERVSKAIEDGKKKTEEFAKSTAALQLAINQQANANANALDLVKEKLADLSGDKAGALAAQMRIISREDAAESVRAIDAITEAFQRQAKAAAEANSWVTKLEVALSHLATSPLDQKTEQIRLLSEEIKNNYNQIVTSDPTKGLDKGKAYLQEELDQQKKLLEAMKGNELSGFDTQLAKTVPLLDNYVAKHGAVTKETVIQQRALVDSLNQELKITEQLISIDQGKKKVASAESAARPDVGEKQLEKLRSETQEQLALAAATGQSAAAQKMEQASQEASAIIAQILTAAHGRLTAALREQLAAVHALTAERQVAKDAIATNAELQKETEGYDRQIKSIGELSDAYAKGGAAVGGALIQKQLEGDRQKVAELTEEYQRLLKAHDDYASGKAALAGAAGPVQGIAGIDPKALEQAKTALDNANAALEKHRQQLEEIRQLNYQEEINKTTDALRGEQPLLDRLNNAYLENAQAVRQAQVALELYHWEQAHPGATPEQIQQENALLEQNSINAQRAADAKAAGQYSIGTLHEDEIDKLLRIKEIIQQNGESTVLIDAKIHDAQDALIKQWDDAAMKVGTFGEKFQAVMNEVALKGQQAAQQMAQSWITAIDGINSNIGKLLTGQKTDFGKVFQNLAEQQTKGQLEQIEGTIGGHFGIKIPGLGGAGKPDGSQSNPLNVKIVGGQSPAAGGHGESAAPGATGNPIAPTATSTLASFLAAFGGFRAGGGTTDRGKSYVVGENGPELFQSSTAGQIVPAGGSGWTFNPRAAYAQPYEAYERWLHRGASSGTLQSLLTLGTGLFFKKLLPGLFGSKQPTPASTATSIGGAGTLEGGGFGAGIGAGSSSIPSGGLEMAMIPNFGGFMAEGGDLTPGKRYIVGENGPEMLSIPQRGAVTSNRDMRGGGATYENHNVRQEFHYHGTDNSDLFKRTTKQNAARQFRDMRSGMKAR